MKNLGITKVVRKSKTRIERATKDGAFAVERDEGILIPRPEFLNAWSGLRFCASGELFGGHETKFEVEELTCVEFAVAPIDGDPNDIQITGITCKGTLFADRRAEFSNCYFYDEKTLEIAEGLYKAAADYFDGKNAQTEFEFTSRADQAQGDEDDEDAGESECFEKCVGVVGCELNRLAKRLEAEGLTQAQCLAYAKKNGLVSGEKIGELDAAKILTAFDVVKEFIAREDA